MLRCVLLVPLTACCLLNNTAEPDDDASGEATGNVTAVVTLLELVVDADEQTAQECLSVLTRTIQNGQLSKAQVDDIRRQLTDRLEGILDDEAHPLRPHVALLTTSWRDPDGTQIAREMFASSSLPAELRRAALDALIAAGDSRVLNQVEATLADAGGSTVEFRGEVLASLGRLNQPAVPRLLLSSYSRLEPDLRPRAIEVLTQRPEWSIELLKAIQAQQVDKDALNLNQIKRVALFQNQELQKLVAKTYGAVRGDQRSDRQQVIHRMRDFLNGTPGNPEHGVAAFKKVCGQCHKIYGEGAEVGPDITRNGRNNWEQLLTNVFDPSAVIGPGYQARTLVTADGRVLTGLPVEESQQRVVLKIQGGKTETIPRDQLEAYAVSDLSMMPEELEKQLTLQEIADLFAFLALDKPPSDPTGRLLPGAPQPLSR